MAITYKIHPAIGIARVGNSPDDFFIGPELPGKQPDPSGGFKDSQCRVKRQAARFRVFAHHDDGTADEIDSSLADITWTVHLVNKKAANPARGNSGSAADLTIDPGSRTVNGPNQRKVFDSGNITLPGTAATNVPLGEIRSDSNNHLLVLGGSGTSGSPASMGIGDFWKNPGWYDDVSDGPVTATITLHSDGSTPPVAGSWVIVAPPKFAPHQDNVITLYDRVLDLMIQAGFATAPTTTSYTNDVYPILQRARDIHWVINISPATAMTWADPVTSDALRQAIFDSLKIPTVVSTPDHDMPQINPPDTADDPSGPLTDRLTATQYAHMQRWNDNTYDNDWAGPPTPDTTVTPDGLDRAALEACAGGSFYPGIEAGGLPQTAAGSYPGLPADSRPIINGSHYVEAFRLDQSTVNAGDITAAMALPWQADFFYCAQNWWPVPRPEQVIRGGVGNQDWIAGVVGSAPEMVAKWNQLGFVVRQGSQHIEVARCDTASIALMTPLLNFQDVPQGPMGMVREAALAIVFEVVSPSSAVTLQYAPGGAPSHPLLSAFNTSVTVGPTSGSSIATARLWVTYKALNAGDVLPPQTVTVQDSGMTQSWTVTIIGNTVARQTSAAALVLDRSGSMSEDRGDGQSKHASLQQACGIFVDVMLEGDGVGLVSFNQTATVLQPITVLGDGSLSDTNRGNTKDIINGNGLDPNGTTSIGNGIQAGRGILNSSPQPFDVNSLVVLTDGMENTPLYIADVASSINEFTYSIGLGKPQDISVPALQAISGNNGGYLLVTGSIGTDNRFLLEKYFLQILAGVSNAEIVLDPNGSLIVGRVEKIPFVLTDADAGVDVILLTPNVPIVDFRLQTPSGSIIEPWREMSEPGMKYISSDGVVYYRVVLPTELSPNRLEAGGVWNALLTIGRPRVDGGQVDTTILRANPVGRALRSASPARGASPLRQQRTAAVEFARFASSDATAGARSVPYNLIVHAYSNVTLKAHTGQASFEPGATIDLSASLAQSGIPLGRGAVWVEVTRPDNAGQTVTLNEVDAGQFSGRYVTTIPGIYRMRFRARGATQSGQPFTREKTLTAAVWRGGDVPQNPGGTVSYWCDLVRCLMEGGAISPDLEKRLAAFGVDIAKVRRCVDLICSRTPSGDGSGGGRGCGQ